MAHALQRVRKLTVTHSGAVVVAPHLDAAIHVVAVQRIKAKAAALGRQLADLADQVVHGFLRKQRGRSSRQRSSTWHTRLKSWNTAHHGTCGCWGPRWLNELIKLSTASCTQHRVRAPPCLPDGDDPANHVRKTLSCSTSTGHKDMG